MAVPVHSDVQGAKGAARTAAVQVQSDWGALLGSHQAVTTAKNQVSMALHSYLLRTQQVVRMHTFGCLHASLGVELCAVV